MTEITVNGRDYPRPARPAVVVCLDGCEPAYLDEARAAGRMPALDAILARGTARTALSVVPSFTNPNNLSIATGAPPSVHGICGNYLFEPETGGEVMMNDPRFLRAPTIFAAFHAAGARVAVVTAKDKLRALLAHGLTFEGGRAVAFSSERADTTTEAQHGLADAARWLGRPVPEVYSAELSGFVLEAGVRLLAERRPDLMYLTTTDYIQHKHAPGMPEANAFYAMVDTHLAALDAAGAALVVTADHGMKPKHRPDGSPDVTYVQDLLDAWLGTGAARVILPITDPYVVHHGALGAFATAYLPDGADRADVIARLDALDALTVVIGREEACRRFDLPPDRIGDIVMISGEGQVIGTSAARHDLSGLTEPLRSHGGLTEQAVPFIVNAALPDLADAPTLRNFDAFHVATRAAARVPAPAA
jgi:phosphonoacetate hydrolase